MKVHAAVLSTLALLSAATPVHLSKGNEVAAESIVARSEAAVLEERKVKHHSDPPATHNDPPPTTKPKTSDPPPPTTTSKPPPPTTTSTTSSSSSKTSSSSSSTSSSSSSSSSSTSSSSTSSSSTSSSSSSSSSTSTSVSSSSTSSSVSSTSSSVSSTSSSVSSTSLSSSSSSSSTGPATPIGTPSRPLTPSEPLHTPTGTPIKTPGGTPEAPTPKTPGINTPSPNPSPKTPGMNTPSPNPSPKTPGINTPSPIPSPKTPGLNTPSPIPTPKTPGTSLNTPTPGINTPTPGRATPTPHMGTPTPRMTPTPSPEAEACLLGRAGIQRLGVGKNTIRSVDCNNKKKVTTDFIITTVTYAAGAQATQVKAKCPKDAGQACFHYSSVISRNSDYSTITCPQEAATTAYRLDASATESWSSQHSGAGWQDAGLQAKCERDEFPPAYLLNKQSTAWKQAGKDKTGQMVRWIPKNDNNKGGQMWKGACFKEAINPIDDNKLETLLKQAIVGVQPDVKKPTQTAYTVGITGPFRPEFTITAWEHDTLGSTDDGLSQNPCWPNTQTNDPGFALLDFDPYYDTHKKPFDYRQAYVKGSNGLRKRDLGVDDEMMGSVNGTSI